jgi:putative phage-type endonuclease
MNTHSNLESEEIPTQQWVQERQHYVGGSQIAAILGESSYSTPLQVWMKKKGIVQPEPSSPITDFGHVFEPVMSDYFEDITGLKTRRVNRPFFHDEHDFLRANIDRQILNGDGVEGTGVLELKTTNSHRLKALEYQYPDEWEYQIQWYLGLTSYTYGFLFIYERDTCEFYEPIYVERNEELIEEMQRRIIEWWQIHMIGGKRPDPINEEDLLILYPDSSDGTVVEASQSDRQLYQQLKQVREEKSELKHRETELKNLLKDKLGDAERLVYGGRTLVSWKSYSRQRLDSTKLREEKPDIYANYQTESRYRRFSVK